MIVFGVIADWLESLLDNSYLFDHDNKRLRSNLQLLFIVLGVTQIFNGVASLAETPTLDMAAVALMPVLLCAVIMWAVPRFQSPTGMLVLTGLFIMVCLWNMLFLTNAGLFSLLWIAIYPISLCFFLGNRYAVPLLVVMFVNILAYITMFNIWSERLGVIQHYDGTIRTQLAVGFACSAAFGVVLEYIHDRTTMHLAIMANQITENSYRDPLTGLLARRAFYERYCAEVEVTGARKPLFVVMCDVDHFKAVNDTYGHAIGDEILKHVSRILKDHSMGKLCFRWGGEEFILFLEDPTLERAISSANKIRVVLEHTPYMDSQIGNIRATMSFGVHAYDRTLTMDKNISIVDEYLYEAKRKGRNRVESIASKTDESMLRG
ncbi:GGDEF domain-containing protein [Clostridia bacterium]|nr:GGDEF domain-containing protein [Clostridia bacterium]